MIIAIFQRGQAWNFEGTIFKQKSTETQNSILLKVKNYEQPNQVRIFKCIPFEKKHASILIIPVDKN